MSYLDILDYNDDGHWDLVLDYDLYQGSATGDWRQISIPSSQIHASGSESFSPAVGLENEIEARAEYPPVTSQKAVESVGPAQPRAEDLKPGSVTAEKIAAGAIHAYHLAEEVLQPRLEGTAEAVTPVDPKADLVIQDDLVVTGVIQGHGAGVNSFAGSLALGTDRPLGKLDVVTTASRGLTVTTDNAAGRNYTVLATNNGVTGSSVYSATASGGSKGVSISASGSGDGLESSTTGTANAGRFSIDNRSSNAHGISAQTNGSGNAENFTIRTTSSTGNAIYANTAGQWPGRAGTFEVTDRSSNASAITATALGTGSAGRFEVDNSGSFLGALSSVYNGRGESVFALMPGQGRAGMFTIDEPTNMVSAIWGRTNGSGPAVKGANWGNGHGGYFEVTGDDNPWDAVSSVTHSGKGGAGRFEVENPSNYAAAVTAVHDGIGDVLASVSNGWGRTGYFETTRSDNYKESVWIGNAGQGSALRIDQTDTDVTQAALQIHNGGRGGRHLSRQYQFGQRQLRALAQPRRSGPRHFRHERRLWRRAGHQPPGNRICGGDRQWPGRRHLHFRGDQHRSPSYSGWSGHRRTVRDCRRVRA